jgi:hypothetical protein
MAYSYPHVEDYIEIIAGFRDAAGKSTYSIFQLPQSPLNLARYDTKIVESFAEQSRNNIGFTDKQSALAVALVLKYERQLLRLQVSIEPVKTTPVFKNPIRNIDRSTRVWIEDDVVKLRFPYKQELIDAIRTQSKESCGRIVFDRASKLWTADLTEYNLNWCYIFSKNNNFEMDPSVDQLMKLILTTEKTPYQIELCAGDNQLYVKNANNTLCEYVENTLGGFDNNNLLTLVDNAPLLGYTVQKVIEDTVIKTHGIRFWSLCANRELKVTPGSAAQDQLKQIVDYATATGRFPIYVYEPDLSDRLTLQLVNYFDSDQIANLNNREAITDATRLAYTNKIPKNAVDRIPLLISTAGMLYGGDRQVWIQTAEKVVYFTNDVYNKNVKGRTICKLD